MPFLRRALTPLASRLIPSFSIVPLVALATLVACSGAGGGTESGDDASEPTGRTAEAIVGGTDSDDGQNAVVLLIHSFTGGFEACSGTLLAPRLVMTARHCLAKTSTEVQCSSTGDTVQGSVSSDYNPSGILVFGGVNRPETQTAVNAASAGVKTFDDGAGTLCNHDIGLLLLDKPVSGANIAPIRLDAVAKTGETVTLVGWGETNTTALPPIRQQRAGVKVIASGVADGVGATEFVLGEGSCEGDSGGPAFAASGAVIGSSSRGGNNTDASGAAGCDNAVNVYTAPLGFKDLILQAYQEAGQAPWLEGQPNPTLAVDGGTCSANQDCQSNNCSQTTKTCDVALPATTTKTVTSCSVAAVGGGSAQVGGDAEMTGGLAFGGLLLVTASRRRRPRRA